MPDESTTLVSMTQDDFGKAITPTPLREEEIGFYFKCPDCGNVHFRHAGYLEVLMPYVRANREKKVCCESYQVKVCTKCRKCFCWINDHMRDVTEHIDLSALEKAEKDLNKATGPGGEC